MRKDLLIAAGATAQLTLIPGAAVRASASPAAGGAKLARCSGLLELPRARCGSIRVPLDRANPSLGTTKVAFALVPRRDASRPSLGTVVPNPGGPGKPTIAQGASAVRSFAPLHDAAAHPLKARPTARCTLRPARPSQMSSARARRRLAQRRRESRTPASVAPPA